MPHQLALVQAAIDPSGPAKIIVRAEVGAGLSTSIVEILRYIQSSNSEGRAILLMPSAPSALVKHTTESLTRAGVKSLVLDRFRFRELLDDEGVRISGWPTGAAFIVGGHTINQADIMEAIVRVGWDMAVVDLGHRSKGMPMELLRRLERQSAKLIVAGSLTLDQSFSDGDKVLNVRWLTKEILEQMRSADPAGNTTLVSVRFEPSNEETIIRQNVARLVAILEKSGQVGESVASFVSASLDSSPVALEQALRRLADRRNLLTFEDGDYDRSESDLLLVESQSMSKFGLETMECVREILNSLDRLEYDSRLSSFLSWLTKFLENSEKGIFVLTSHRATLFYLAAEIENLGKECRVIHGEVSITECNDALDGFLEHGGVLLATPAALEGLSLHQVVDVVIYDGDHRSRPVERSLCRFRRVGRTSPLTIHLFVPASYPNSVQSRILGALCTLGAEKDSTTTR